MEGNPIIIQCYQNVISYIKKRVINYIFDRKLLTWYAIFKFVFVSESHWCHRAFAQQWHYEHITTVGIMAWIPIKSKLTEILQWCNTDIECPGIVT